MTADKLSQRRRITDTQTAQIVQLALRQVPQAEIARRVGLHRNTVHRVLERTRATISINEDTEQERAEAIALYREIQRTAWATIDRAEQAGQPIPGRFLAEIRQAQTRIDALLGLAPSGPDDPEVELARFKRAVLSVIQSEAPELGPKLAQRLLAMREEEGT